LAPTEVKLSGFHVSGSNNLESLTFFNKNATPTMAAIIAAAPAKVMTTIGIVLSRLGEA
jgi:hypothetical protein